MIETITATIVALPAIMLLMWAFEAFTLALGRRRLHVYVMSIPTLDSVEIDRMALLKALNDSINAIHGEALEDSTIEYMDAIHGTVYATCAPVQYKSYLECQADIMYNDYIRRSEAKTEIGGIHGAKNRIRQAQIAIG